MGYMPNPIKPLVVDTNFVSWPKHMHPGHCFIWSKPLENITYYSLVLQTPPHALRLGYRFSRTFGPPFPDGYDFYVHQDVATILLSQEQMDLAQRLGWPQDEVSLSRIFSVPPN
jgi:hypothetical protein